MVCKSVFKKAPRHPLRPREGWWYLSVTRTCVKAARAERVREAGARPHPHAKVACTRTRSWSAPAPAREAGVRLHPHAKLECACTRTRRSPAPAREAGVHLHPHAKVACTHARSWSAPAPAREGRLHPCAKVASCLAHTRTRSWRAHEREAGGRPLVARSAAGGHWCAPRPPALVASRSRLCSARCAETAHEKPFLFLW